jgi:hypothetical protein
MNKTACSLRHNGYVFDGGSCQLHGEFALPPAFRQQQGVANIFDAADDSFCPELVRAVEGVRYIAEVSYMHCTMYFK